MLTEKDYCDYDTCVALWNMGLIPHPYDNTDTDKVMAIISLYEAQKFLREEKKMHIEIWTVGKKPIRYCYTVHTLNHTGETKGWSSGKRCNTYEEALSEGIKEAIKILKEK